MIYLKRGGYVHYGKEVTSKDVDNFDAMVKKGMIEEAETEKPESDLMKLKKDELQAKCKELEIDFEESFNKAQLVALIEAETETLE